LTEDFSALDKKTGFHGVRTSCLLGHAGQGVQAHTPCSAANASAVFRFTIGRAEASAKEQTRTDGKERRYL
jgi:hypothetical protein